jgi:hypothetical protein
MTEGADTARKPPYTPPAKSPKIEKVQPESAHKQPRFDSGHKAIVGDRVPSVAKEGTEWIKSIAPLAPEVLQSCKEPFSTLIEPGSDGVTLQKLGADPHVATALKKIRCRFGKLKIPKPGQRPGNVKQPGPSLEIFARSRPEFRLRNKAVGGAAKCTQVAAIADVGQVSTPLHTAYTNMIIEAMALQSLDVYVNTDQVQAIIASGLKGDRRFVDYFGERLP